MRSQISVAYCNKQGIAMWGGRLCRLGVAAAGGGVTVMRGGDIIGGGGERRCGALRRTEDEEADEETERRMEPRRFHSLSWGSLDRGVPEERPSTWPQPTSQPPSGGSPEQQTARKAMQPPKRRKRQAAMMMMGRGSWVVIGSRGFVELASRDRLERGASCAGRKEETFSGGLFIVALV